MKFHKIAGVAQLVERQPSKLNVAGSNPVSRSKVECRLVKSVIIHLRVNVITPKSVIARSRVIILTLKNVVILSKE